MTQDFTKKCGFLGINSTHHDKRHFKLYFVVYTYINLLNLELPLTGKLYSLLHVFTLQSLQYILYSVIINKMSPGML